MRARNIKPGVFKNELLGTADPLLTILFQGLWCLADREGRLEDRPLRIKAEIFPYRENLDVNGSLTELASLGFIERYVAGGNACIQKLNFRKHQTPHKTEKHSILPPKILNIITTGSGSVNTSDETEKKTEVLPPDSLNPDSLIADSPRAQQQKGGFHFGEEKRKLTHELPEPWKAECIAEMKWPPNVAEDVWVNFRIHNSKTPDASLRNDDEWAAAWRGWYRRERIPASAQTKPDFKASIDIAAEARARNNLMQKYQGNA